MSRLFVRLMITLSMTGFFEEFYAVSRKRLAAEVLNSFEHALSDPDNCLARPQYFADNFFPGIAVL
jgi:hypothetical protein